MRTKILTVALAWSVLALWFPLKGEERRDGYWFLDTPVSSHVAGLGGAGTALVDADVMVSQANPALLGAELGRQLGVGYVNWMGSNLFSARYGQAAGTRGAWGAGLTFLDHGRFDGYDDQGIPTGSFRASDFIAEGMFSHDFNDLLRGGISVKTIVSDYESYSAVALGFDLGLNWYDPDRDLSLGVALRNLGGQLKSFEGRADHLPLDLSLGLMKGLGTSPFALTVRAGHLTDWKSDVVSDGEGLIEEKKFNFGQQVFRHLSFGLQYEPLPQFYAALGYDYRTRSDMEGYGRTAFSGISAGVGLSVRKFLVGVSFSQPHKGASAVTVNLGFDFDGLMGF